MTHIQLSPDQIRALQQVQLELLLEFDRVCRELGIAYQLGAGSLLGAIRHGGFIPWDDDVDVVLLRGDYERFLAEGPALLRAECFLQTRHSDGGFHELFVKLRRHDSEFRESARARVARHHGIFIDIFPFDAVSTRTVRGRLHLSVALVLRRLAIAATPEGRERIAAQPWGIRRALGLSLHMLMRMVPAPLRLGFHERWLRLLDASATGEVTCLAMAPTDHARALALVRPAAEVASSARVPFEGHLLPVPLDPHTTLERLYGDWREWPAPGHRAPSHQVVAFRLPPPWHP